jgi:flagellar assembly factor FliW
MDIQTTRFGKVAIDAEDILLFPHGLMGFEDCQHWVLLADAVNPAVGWLQSMTHASLAMPVISPRRFVREYQLRLTRGELAALQLGATDRAYVLSLVSDHDGALTTNLKAPIVVNLQRRLGRQVVTADEQPLRHELARKTIPLRKTA